LPSSQPTRTPTSSASLPSLLESFNNSYSNTQPGQSIASTLGIIPFGKSKRRSPHPTIRNNVPRQSNKSHNVPTQSIESPRHKPTNDPSRLKPPYHRPNETSCADLINNMIAQPLQQRTKKDRHVHLKQYQINILGIDPDGPSQGIGKSNDINDMFDDVSTRPVSNLGAIPSRTLESGEISSSQVRNNVELEPLRPGIPHDMATPPASNEPEDKDPHLSRSVDGDPGNIETSLRGDLCTQRRQPASFPRSQPAGDRTHASDPNCNNAAATVGTSSEAASNEPEAEGPHLSRSVEGDSGNIETLLQPAEDRTHASDPNCNNAAATVGTSSASVVTSP
jgi:hypothetical protein